MSHNKPNSYGFTTKKRHLLSFVAAVALSTGALATTAPAFAAINPGLKTEQGRTSVYKMPFERIATAKVNVLDWKNPSTTLTFDIPDSDWIDGLELLISADPEGAVSHHMPILVSFNGAKPVPVKGQGSSFDARIRLNKSYVRPNRNQLTFTYMTPAGQDCLKPSNGAWHLDFKHSSIVVKTRAKSRNYQVREVENRLKSSAVAPGTVSLLARGPNALKLQALAAQGVGLRMDNIPDFRLTKGRSDMDIIMGTRHELVGWVTDEDILTDHGPRASVHEGRPMKLVLTGDTQAEVLEMAQAFSRYQLPNTRRNQTSSGEMFVQNRFEDERILIEKRKKISDFPVNYLDDSWGKTPQAMTFDVSDPLSSEGRVLLRINASKKLDKDSRLAVELNGQSLGYTQLDKTRKSVAFDIPVGTLQATENKLTISPDIEIQSTNFQCSADIGLPGFYLGSGSKIEIKKLTRSPATELSRFAASGAPFSNNYGSDTTVVFSGTSSSDKAASMKVLARLAKASGAGWTEAGFKTAYNLNADNKAKNLLVIGPNNKAAKPFLIGAPKSLTTAMTGQATSGQLIRKTAMIERYASADGDAVMRDYAAQQRDYARITRGGVAALYPSSLANGKIVGVITNSPSRSFTASADQLIAPDHWNRLQGSVTRWDKTDVLMAQIATPTQADSRAPNFQTPDVDWSWATNAWDDVSMGASNMAEATRTKFTDLKLSVANQFAEPEIASTAISTTVAPKITTKPAPSKTVMADIKSPAPKLRGLSEVPRPSSTQQALFDWDLFKSRTQQSWKHTKTSIQNFEMPELNLKKSELHNKVTNAQNSLAPMRAKLTRMFKRKTGGAQQAFRWGDHNMSLPAILLILTFIIVFIGMGIVSASDRTGNYH